MVVIIFNSSAFKDVCSGQALLPAGLFSLAFVVQSWSYQRYRKSCFEYETIPVWQRLHFLLFDADTLYFVPALAMESTCYDQTEQFGPDDVGQGFTAWFD